MAEPGVSDEKPLLDEELDDLKKIKGDEDESETQKLKRLFLTFKTKYQQALKELAKREHAQESSPLVQKYQEAQEEIASLVQQQKQLKQLIVELRKHKESAVEDENRHLKEELAKIQSKLDSAALAMEEMQIEKSPECFANEKTVALQKQAHIQKIVEDFKLQLKMREAELHDAKAEIAAVKAEKQELQRMWEQESREKNEREGSLSSLADQIHAFKKELLKMQQQAKEKEEGILEAKQHLAKKVKEAAYLSEITEEKSRQIGRLQEDVVNLKTRLAETHSALESQVAQTKKVMEQIAGWEEKYFRAYERLQEAEAQNRELKKVEEKHLQMQNLLSNLGNMLGHPVGLTQPIGMVRAPDQPIDSQEKKRKKTKSQESSQDSLFDVRDPTPKYKTDLFE